jgi:hypothetical protein
MAPTRLDIKRTGMRNDESVKEYAMRLREMAIQVYPPVLENELNPIFINTLKTPYCDYISGNSLTYFIEVITTTNKVEQGLKLKRI